MNINKNLIEKITEKQQDKLHAFTKKYTEQYDLIASQMEEGETFVHAVDMDSFGGAFYRPEWAVTSHARVWSLRYRKWLKPQMRTKRQYSYGNILASRLIANYFCNKIAVNRYGEKNVEVHHMQPLDVDNPDITVNYASNLQYIRKDLHYEITAIQCGRKLPDYLTLDKITANAMESIAENPKTAQIWVEYTDHGEILHIKTAVGDKSVKINPKH